LAIAKKSGDLWDKAASFNSLGLVYLEKSRPNSALALVNLQKASAHIIRALKQCRDLTIREQIKGMGGRIFNN
jgi:hypothetical protein